MKNKSWLSRKFIIAVSTQLTALLVLCFPAYESDVMQASQAITAMCVLVMTSLGYISVQGKIDQNLVENENKS
ncbi:hypothetical protein JD969_09020 [Planctomycetota bacterium]|nr:hypothetical protein JD969_09020 [Planctomycetota bacterium]